MPLAGSLFRAWPLVLLSVATGCQWVAGFDERRLVEQASGGASGAGIGGDGGAGLAGGGSSGDAGQSGEGGAAGSSGASGQSGEGGVGGEGGAGGAGGEGGEGGISGASGQGGSTAGKRPPTRPDGEAVPQGGKTLSFASLRLHLGAYDPANCKADNTCQADPAAWKSLGYDLDGRCSGGCTASGATPSEGNDCIDNSLGSFIGANDGKQAEIESTTNQRLLAGGVALALRLSDIGSGPDDPYVPGELFLVASADEPQWDGSDVRDAEERSLVSGQAGLPLLRFPGGYLRGNTWVSGDFAERVAGRLQLPLSVNEGALTQDQLLDFRCESLTVVVPLDDAHQTAGLGTLNFLSSISELSASLLPIFLGATGSCSAFGASLLLNELASKVPDLVVGAPGYNAEGACDGVSGSVGIAFRPVIFSGKARSTLPSLACDACIPGTKRCNGSTPELCEAPSFQAPVFKALPPCSAGFPTCVEGECVAAESLGCGNDHTCVSLSSEGPLDGRVYCWGKGDQRQTGQGVALPFHRPVPLEIPGKVRQLSSKFHHTCAALDDGKVFCWGNALQGQLGPALAASAASAAPVEVPLPGAALRVEVGFYHSCALLAESGRVACWGSNQLGQLGQGSNGPPLLAPGLVQAPSGQPLEGVQHLALGELHTCAALASGDVYCWGVRGDGCWGCAGEAISSIEIQPKAALVASGAPVLGLVAGQGATFLLREDHKLMAMGFNEQGQLGLSPSTPPVELLQPSFSGVLAVPLLREVSHTSGEFACGLGLDDALVCWGDNGIGQLGLSMSEPLPPPITPKLPQASRVCAGGRFTCAVDPQGQLRCWGHNGHGQLGNGAIEDAGFPDPSAVGWWNP